jgi:hypothetical protein
LIKRHRFVKNKNGSLLHLKEKKKKKKEKKKKKKKKEKWGRTRIKRRGNLSFVEPMTL